jgi:hypothetical protein
MLSAVELSKLLSTAEVVCVRRHVNCTSQRVDDQHEGEEVVLVGKEKEKAVMSTMDAQRICEQQEGKHQTLLE